MSSSASDRLHGVGWPSRKVTHAVFASLSDTGRLPWVSPVCNQGYVTAHLGLGGHPSPGVPSIGGSPGAGPELSGDPAGNSGRSENADQSPDQHPRITSATVTATFPDGVGGLPNWAGRPEMSTSRTFQSFRTATDPSRVAKPP